MSQATDTVELDNDALTWHAAYLQAEQNEKEWAAVKQRAREHLEALLGERETGTHDGRVLVRWSYVESTRLDATKLKSSEPDVYARYSKPQTSRRFTIPRDQA